MNLTGKIALVTGGSRGIGAAVVQVLAERGARVAFTYSSNHEAADAVMAAVARAGGTALAIRADAADRAVVRSAVQQVVRTWGPVDILVNNAGVFVAQPDMSDADYDRQMAVNVDAVWAATQEAVKHMPKGGRIICIGSALGQMATMPGVTEYAATKAAVAMLARGWARDLASRGITSNCVEPGPTDTEMNPAGGEFAKFQAPRTALGRYGTPVEVAAAVAFLASPEASYITGAVLPVDGGWLA